jgi:hypothetical protein
MLPCSITEFQTFLRSQKLAASSFPVIRFDAVALESILGFPNHVDQKNTMISRECSICSWKTSTVAESRILILNIEFMNSGLVCKFRHQ